MVDQGEELIYHDIPSPRSQEIPSGAAQEETSPPKKGLSNFIKICIGIMVLCSIALAVIFTRPGASSMFGNAPAAADGSQGDVPSYYPTYWPTYAPTYAPTYVPTVAVDELDATTTAATTTAAATTTTVDEIATIAVDLGNITTVTTTEAPVTTTEAPVTTTEAPVTTTEAPVTTTEAPFNLTDIIEAIENEIEEDELVTNIIEAIEDEIEGDEIDEDEIDETTSTTSTLPATTTTTEKPHPVCGTNVDAKVFKIQITPSEPMASYTFTSVLTGAVLSNVTAATLPVGEVTEERICILPGEYEFSMSAGACVDGYFRGELVLFSCNEGTIVVEVEDKSFEDV